MPRLWTPGAAVLRLTNRAGKHQALSSVSSTKPKAMEYEKIVFFRNLFFRAFIVGLAFALFYFVATCLFWRTGAAWATHFFKIEEKEFGRLVVVFFFLVPALALHWMSRKK